MEIRRILSFLVGAVTICGCAPLHSNASDLGIEAAQAAQVQEHEAATEVRQQVAGVTPPACPALDFKGFLHAFSENPDIQREFTKLPLEHGILDPAAIDTKSEYTLTSIRTFERIPQFDPKQGGAILGNDKHRKREHLLLVVEKDGAHEDPEYPNERRARNDRVARLYLADTGFHIYFRFQPVDDCWFLRAIHDKST